MVNLELLTSNLFSFPTKQINEEQRDILPKIKPCVSLETLAVLHQENFTEVINYTVHTFTTFTGEQAIVIARNLVSTDRAQLVKARLHIWRVLHVINSGS